ncbi:MAG: hypothetical protein KatS3mg108_0628 [Isosphaeraceae bacterium]|jgi:uncharacterized protein YbbC (DUF1343 family)/CubicO group peptidase (beta-lactamase class C family)|nr:MAG: hypothetical protein KatS3mg108_0628 [Isosphaeraceae bacterium]
MICFVGCLLALVMAQPPSRLPEASPAEVGMDPARLARIDALLTSAVQSRQIPGAVALVGRHGKIVYRKAFGARALVPQIESMSVDTLFDLASLTKPIATATAAMTLIESGQLRLDATLRDYLPEFDNHGKGRITIEQLLRHRSGFIADNPLGDYADGPDTAWQRLANLELVHPPNARFLYSDVNYIVLGRIIERVSGMPLDRYCHQVIFEPLGMTQTSFHPQPVERVAPTEPDQGSMLRGVVHDPRARALGGVAGHAGLFSTADDLAIYAHMLLNGGLGISGRRVLSPLGVRLMTSPGNTPPNQRRGLGWDIATGFSAPRGSLFGEASFGHTGFTGTSLWIDPETQTFVILLTSRLHPDGKGATPTALRRNVSTLVASAITDASSQLDQAQPPPRLPEVSRNPTPSPTRDRQPAASPVRCGIDVLIARQFEGLRGKRLGLVTNHTGITGDGRSTIDVLANAEGLTLAALFSPEHGIRGALDREIPDDRDPQTGLPIYSLYGPTRKPTAEQLAGLDTLVYDIQDIGTRFYTYISTLGLCLEAAKEHNIQLVVLDRPNPIGGVRTDGPVRADQYESFIAFHAIPLVHGMTVGELARLFNAERQIGADLVVVPCEGWTRNQMFDATGLLWVNPSPNMRSLTEALLYPGVGMLEATNLATGRGTDTPFERLGAPWIDPRSFAAALNARNLAGVRFIPIRFTPTERQYAGQSCGGVFVQIVDRDAFDPIDLGLGLALTLRALYPDQWQPEPLKPFVADDATYDAILAGRPIERIRAGWLDKLERFREIRARYLIYPSSDSE